MNAIIALIIAYLLGSASTSIILSKVMKFPDPRTEGSGNAGATNVLRTVGQNQALMVLLGDILKGFLAVLIGRILGVHGFALGLVAFVAVVGHVFPVYFKFKGGKGVATALGAILMLNFLVGLIAMAVWAGVAYFFKYASLASLVAIATALVLTPIFSQVAYLVPVLLIAGLIGWKHWENIERLRAGTENKMEFKI